MQPRHAPSEAPMKRILLVVPEFYGAPGGVQAFMHRLHEALCYRPEDRDRVVDCVSLNDERDAQATHSFAVHDGYFSGWGRSKIKFIAELIGRGAKAPYDLALFGHLGQSPVAPWLAKLGLVRRYAIVLHGFEAWERVWWPERHAAAVADAVIATTKYTARAFAAKNNIAEKKLRIVPLSIAATREQVLARALPAASRAGEFRILTVGRLDTLDYGKGVEFVIKAMSRLVKFPGNVKLVIVGDGADRPRLQRLVEDLELQASVSMPGRVDDVTLAELYRSSDLMVLSSRQEGFGIVFLEAMSHGKPCIGGNYGGIPEVIEDGRTGFLVPFGDADAIASRVTELATNPERWRSMSQAAFERVLARYCFDSFARNVAAIVDEMLGCKRTGAAQCR